MPPPEPAAKPARDMPCDELVTTLMPRVGSGLVDYPVAFVPRVEVRRRHVGAHSPGRLQRSAWREAGRYADLIVDTGQLHLNRVVVAHPVVAVETYEGEAHKLFVFTFDREGVPKLALREESVSELGIRVTSNQVWMIFRPSATAPPRIVSFSRRGEQSFGREFSWWRGPRALSCAKPYLINVNIRGVRSPFTERPLEGKRADLERPRAQ